MRNYTSAPACPHPHCSTTLCKSVQISSPFLPKPPLTGQIVHSSTPWPSARVLHTCHSTLVIAQEIVLPCTMYIVNCSMQCIPGNCKNIAIALCDVYCEMYECAACKGTCLVQDTLHCPLWWLLKLISNSAPKSIKAECSTFPKSSLSPSSV